MTLFPWRACCSAVCCALRHHASAARCAATDTLSACCADLLAQGWSKKDGQILTDEYGRPTPNTDMYPSAANGAGMKPLADALAARGLKLGLWFMRGVPRSAATKRLPILGSNTNSTCLEAARFDKPCFWSTSCHGSSYPSAAADEYYRSVAQLLKEWGVEFVKADCFFPNMPYPGPQPHGYYDEDIIGFGSAMKDAGVTVSWSPGISVTPANGTFIARHGYGASYRVSEDMWDLYDSAEDGTFPTGIKQKLSLSESYAHLIGLNNSFPDWDMCVHALWISQRACAVLTQALFITLLQAAAGHHDARQQGQGRLWPGVANVPDARRADDDDDALVHHPRAAHVRRPPAAGRRRQVDAAAHQCVPQLRLMCNLC